MTITFDLPVWNTVNNLANAANNAIPYLQDKPVFREILYGTLAYPLTRGIQVATKAISDNPINKDSWVKDTYRTHLPAFTQAVAIGIPAALLATEAKYPGSITWLATTHQQYFAGMTSASVSGVIAGFVDALKRANEKPSLEKELDQAGIKLMPERFDYTK